MALSRSQLAVARQALGVASANAASPRERLALLLAGLVESDLTALRGGDRDSTGFLQQRPSQGWGPVGESVQTDAAQFLRAARKVNRGGFSGSAGELAQAVQRSGFPGRYDERRAEAAEVLGTLGSSPVRPTSGQPDPASPAEPALFASAPGPSSGVAALVAAMQQPRSRPATAGIESPGFAARAPSAGFGVQSAGGPVAKPDVSALLDAVRTGPAQMPARATETPSAGTERARTPERPQGGLARRGRVILSAGADRAGVPTSRSILRVAEMVAGEHGKPLTVGTGSAHSRKTVSGNVSEHWVGRGVDVPAAGAELTDLGRDALVALGVKPKRAAQMARQGGIFNIPYGKKRRVQVIVNTDGHYDHLHLGVSS